MTENPVWKHDLDYALYSWYQNSKMEIFFAGALGGVKNLRVTDPTMTSLNVKWDPADGAVRQYKIFFVPAAGRTEAMVGLCLSQLLSDWKKYLLYTIYLYNKLYHDVYIIDVFPNTWKFPYKNLFLLQTLPWCILQILHYKCVLSSSLKSIFPCCK